MTDLPGRTTSPEHAEHQSPAMGLQQDPGVLRRLDVTNTEAERLTHYLFRYPAKFHPPIAKALLEQYTQPGDQVLDMFCGSGTLLIEAAVAGRHAIGSDIDPVAVFVSRAKTYTYDLNVLRTTCERLLDRLQALQRNETEYEWLQFADISVAEAEATTACEELWVPAIPNLYHWFRRYVVVDLARLHRAIRQLDASDTVADFLWLCFASILRAASNADPVPVSGLEVTAHMKRRDARGRVVNPFVLFKRAVKRALPAVEQYQAKVQPGTRIEVLAADATRVAASLRHRISAVITSSPYHNAVDYYRRHQLEMY